MGHLRHLIGPLLLLALSCGSDEDRSDYTCVASCTEGTQVRFMMSFAYADTTEAEANQQCNFDKLELDASACGTAPLVCLCASD